MASNPTDVTDLVGFLKPVFGKLQMLIPEEARCQKLFPFAAGDRVGKYFEEPVQVRASWGVTYAGSSGDTVDLADALPSKTESAQITPFLTVLREQISYGLLDRGGGGDDGKRAFMSAGAFIGKEMTMQLRRLLELSILTGQQGFGTIASTSGTTTQVWTISAATLRPGVLSFLEGAFLDLYQSDLATAVTNATAVQCTAVDIDAGTVTVATPSNPTSNVAGYVIFMAGANAAGTFNEMVGLRKQVGATSGTVFNVSKTTYSAWRGNVVSSIGAWSAGALLNMASKAINRGFQGRFVALMGPKAWNVLNSRIISQQVFDQSYSATKMKEGTDGIEINGTGVTIECYAHSYQADGECLLLPKEYVKRIGSAMEGSDENGDRDISFAIPGSTAKYLQPVANKTCVEMQCRSDQAIYVQRPAWSVLGTGITY